MSGETSMSGGPNPAIAGGPSAGGQQILAGQSEAGAERVTGNAQGVDPGQSDRTGQPKGNLGSAPGGTSPQNVGLAKVFAGQSEAGTERVTGNAQGVDPGQSDRTGQPKGNLGPNQSNDTVLPQWTEQLSKKMTADPNSAARLQAFKSLDEFVQASLDAAAVSGEQLALPGANATAQEIQAFYERLGKPKEAVSYSFAKSDPALAKVAFGANLTSSQADAVYTASLAQLDDMRNGIKASLAQDFQATDVLMQKEFGDKYDDAIVLMQRGMGNNPTTGELSPIARALIDAGLAGKPEIVRAFIELGRVTSEGTGAGGSAGAGLPDSIMTGRGFAYKDDYSTRS